MSPAFGFGFEAGQNVLSLELARLMHDRLGATRIRFMWQRPLIQKQKDGPLDLSFINPSIDNAIAAGLEPSAGLYFFNDWMTGGPWLRSYDCLCTKNARSIKADEGAPPECFRITYDSEAIFNQAAALWKEIGDRVKFADLDNEPGEDEYFHGVTDETPQQRVERWFSMIALPFVRGIRSVQPAAKFRAQLDEFCDYAHLLKVERDSGERVIDEIGCHPYADVEAHEDSTYTMFDRNEVTGEVGEFYDLEETTIAVRAKLVHEFRFRTMGLQGRREMPISEIQHCDNFQLMRLTGTDVSEHNWMRYITAHEVYPSKLLPGLPGGNGKFELTDEGERFSRQMNPSRHRSVGK